MFWKRRPNYLIPIAMISGLFWVSVYSQDFVDESSCAKCHADIQSDYEQVGMFNSFYRPGSRPSIEDFSKTFHHESSDRYYQFLKKGDDLVFRRFQRDSEGERINELDMVVDWIMGSGNHVRTYLFQTPSSEIFEFPVSWYTQSQQWQMSPGYDLQDHDGVGRRVRYECMNCHNSNENSIVVHGPPPAVHSYSDSLPEGIGCQRCHGPGAEHVRLAETPGATENAISDAIINPAGLPAQRRHEICMSCHMLPSVVIPSIRRFDQPEFGYRPGQPVSKHRLWLEIDEAGRKNEDRFEIDHHAYRLLQSRCFQKSNGKLSCLTCHDPHRKVMESERIEHYSAICQQCHNEPGFDSGHETMVASWKQSQDQYKSTQANDCAACHMPSRRTQDVVHVAMTDHMIRRTPLKSDPLAPLEERTPTIDNIRLLFPGEEQDPNTWDLYRTIATLRAANSDHGPALDHLERYFATRSRPEIEPYLEMSRAQLKMGRLKKARTTVNEIIRRDSKQPKALHTLALLETIAGNRDQALKLFKQVILLEPAWSDGHLGLGRVLRDLREYDLAARSLLEVVRLRPNSAIGWYDLGRIYVDQTHWQKAKGAFQQCLAIDPRLTEGYEGLADAFVALGERDDALRYLRHGINHARESAGLLERLKALAQEN